MEARLNDLENVRVQQPREQPICDLASTCRSLFTQIISRGSGESSPDLRQRVALLFRQHAGQSPLLTIPDLCDDFEQFRVWTRNLGVFATDNSSLDFRLREANEVRGGVVSLLQSLSSDLSQCVTYTPLHS